MNLGPIHLGGHLPELPVAAHTISGAPTSICGFVGYTARGIDNLAQAIFSFADYTRLYGGLASDSELSYAVQQFFSNGGTQACVVRTPRPGAVKASVTFAGLTFTARSSGLWANGNLFVEVARNNVPGADTMAFHLTVTNVTDGTVESFPNVSLDTTRSNFVVKVVNDPGGGSRLVTVAVSGGASTPPVTGTVAHYALGTGNTSGSGESGYVAGVDGTTLPGTTQLIGDPNLLTGIYALGNVQALNLLCIPDATRAMAGDANALDTSVALDPNAVWAAAIAFCESRKAFLLVDCPPAVNHVAAAAQWKMSGLTVNDANGAAFFPRLRLPDALNNSQLRTFAPCGVVAGLYARIDSTRGVWTSPAGTEATLNGVQQLACQLSDAEQGVLDPLGLNCFRSFPVYGPVLWGARTLAGADAEASQWKYVAVRRAALFLESSLLQGTHWVVFEPNDEPLWAAIRVALSAFMHGLFTQGAFQGQTPVEAYFVKCDSETTTQTNIGNGIVNIVVGFAPLKPAEFVVIEIQQMAGQARKPT